MKRHGKKYRKAAEMIDEKKEYSLAESIDFLLKTAVTKFDSTAEIHMKLGIDTTQADQNVRGVVSLPHGTGKKVRVIAFVQDDKVKEAKDAGAIEAGEDILIEKIVKGWMDFDVVMATPDVMKKLGKVAKILGQKGLMPNPKAGTVNPDVKGTISTILKGQIEYRNDKNGNLHNIFGKVSFGAEKLLENVNTYIKAISDARPTGVKGTYIRSLTLTTTMGPGVRLNVNETLNQ